MRFTESNLVIPLTSGFVSLTAGVELDSFHMKGYDHATIILQFDAALGTSDSHNPILTVETASSDSGDSAKDLTFNYRWNSATTITASADVLGTFASASTLTITAATYAGNMLILEWDANSMPTASKQYEWATVDISAESCSVGKIEGYAVLSNARYMKSIMPKANV